tara:strand:- start:817 stop:1044 length:228 start_codon:yes stop_codon:yes gene_type:complete
MSRSYVNPNRRLRYEPKTKFDRRITARAERHAIKQQLAGGEDDPFYAVITGHSDATYSIAELDMSIPWQAKQARK